jgi:hypothetical protein
MAQFPANEALALRRALCKQGAFFLHNTLTCAMPSILDGESGNIGFGFATLAPPADLP